MINEATGNSLIRNSNIEDEYLKILYLNQIKKVLFKKNIMEKEIIQGLRY